MSSSAGPETGHDDPDDLAHTIPQDEPMERTAGQQSTEASATPFREVIDLTADDDDQPEVSGNASASPDKTPVVKPEPVEVTELLGELPELDEFMTHASLDYLVDHTTGSPDGASNTMDHNTAGLTAPWAVTNENLQGEDRAQDTAATTGNGLSSGDGQFLSSWQEPEGNVFDAAIDDIHATEAFTQLTQAYERKKAAGKTEFLDEVEFERLKAEEATRLRLLRDRPIMNEEPQAAQGTGDDQRMFVNQSDEDDPVQDPPPFREDPVSKSKSYRKSDTGRGVEAGAARLANSDSEANASEPKAGGRKRGRKAKDPKLRGTKRRGPKDGGISKKRKTTDQVGRKGPQMSNVVSLFHNDIVGNAQANHGREAQPGFESRNKKDALKELIASIPSDQRKPYAADMKSLDEACKVFRHRGQGSMHADRAGGWRLKGMRTSLKHHQLLGTAWMRKREISSHVPFGGLVADQMGYGKTIQLITNIVEGKPQPKSRNKTTLVVCPSSLCDQWLEEIQKHVEPGVLGEVMVYRPGNRVKTSDTVQTLRNCAIVITTFHEVMQNFPKRPVRSDLTTPEAKEAYWKEYFEARKGPLFRIVFHRIILDEAHVIKNHRGRTSEACLYLQGKYRWLLTGTPLSNCIEELYAYMAFLGCEEARSYELFRKNFCKRTDTSTSRIHALLLKIMLRRTGGDEIFGRPLINLPALAHETIQIDFTPFEQAAYDIVKTRFIARLNELSVQGQLQKQSKNVFTMLLRLRQICSHFMLVSHILKDLLELEDLERLWRLTTGETVRAQNEHDIETMTILRRTLARQVAESTKDATAITEEPGPKTISTGGQAEVPNDLRLDQNPKSGFKFRPFLRSLREGETYTEIESRALCKKCREIPQNPRLTIPCGHLYCGECIDIMLYDPMTEEARDSATCYECHQQFCQSQECEYGADAGSSRNSPAGGGDRRRRTGSADSDRSEHGWLNIRGAPIMSTKTQAIKATLRKWIGEDADCKCIIFTQFLGIIKVLQRVCKWEGWGYCLFTGDMSPDARTRSIREFREKEEKNIFISSMRAGSLGLNLTMAHKCIIVDPWWNESAEEQAFSRIFRIGQERDVEIKRFVIRGSIDVNLLLKMQERKTAEINRALGDGMGGSRRQQDPSIHDLMHLFGPTQRDAQGRIVVDRDGSPATPVADQDDSEDEDFVFAGDQATQIVQDDSDAELSVRVPGYALPA